MRSVTLAPSILSADFSRLGDQVREAVTAGGQYIHVDVMDGHFVPNITIGPLIVRALRPIADELDAVLDVHLMIEHPDRYVSAFADAGADFITIHVEATPHVHRTVQSIHEHGAKAGVALNPATPISALEEIAAFADLLLVMSVNPGFGGQRYIASSTDKVRRLRALLDEIGSDAELEVDGGVKAENSAEIVNAGATVLVAGSAIFNDRRSIADNIAAFRRVIG